MPKYADEYGISEIFDILKATYLPKSEAPQPSTGTPLADRTVGEVGISRRYAREDHVHPSDTSKAPINSPNFLGTPTAPTAAVGTASQQIANTQFVQNALSNSGFQHALTAGPHIRIENNVISAYSIGEVDDVRVNGNSIVSQGVANITDFRGATVAQAGTAGLVPAPANWENEKFLCADGTWRSVNGGGSGGGGVNYSKEEQDTGIRWIDGRPIYQLTLDLNDYDPVPLTQGYVLYTIDVVGYDMDTIIDTKQLATVNVDGGYIFTTLDGDVHSNYQVGLSSNRLRYSVWWSTSTNIYAVRYITIRYIKKAFMEFNWDFTQTLTDSIHGISTFQPSNLNRDSSGLHLTETTSANIYGQPPCWNHPEGSQEVPEVPDYDEWVLEIDVASVSAPTSDHWTNIFNMKSGRYGFLGVRYDSTEGVYRWEFNTATELGGANAVVARGLDYFSGHTIKIHRWYDNIFILKDNTLIYTYTKGDFGNGDDRYIGNFVSLGCVGASSQNGYSLPCTITGCRFKAIVNI